MMQVPNFAVGRLEEPNRYLMPNTFPSISPETVALIEAKATPCVYFALDIIRKHERLRSRIVFIDKGTANLPRLAVARGGFR